MLPDEENGHPATCRDCGHPFDDHRARHTAASSTQIESWMECPVSECQCMLALVVDIGDRSITAYPISERHLSFDPHLARDLTGKTVILDIAYYDSSGNYLENRQIFGPVLRVTLQEGLVIGEKCGEIKLPPMLDQFEPAEPGSYALDSRDVVVVNPDFIASWGHRLPLVGA